MESVGSPKDQDADSAIASANSLQDLFPHLQDSEALMLAYLQKNPNPQEELENLRVLIHKQGMFSTTPSDVSGPWNWLRDQIQSDFETDNTLQIDGWILSKTEVQLCLLALLEADHAG